MRMNQNQNFLANMGSNSRPKPINHATRHVYISSSLAHKLLTIVRFFLEHGCLLFYHSC